MNQKTKINNLILYSILIITFLGSLFHFVYDLSGNSKLVGIFVPINESVWEHLKLAFYPIVIWYLVVYFIYKNKLYIDFRRWFISMTISIVISIFIILALFYIYTGALGITSTFFDIFIYFIAIIVSQLIISEIYHKIRTSDKNFYISIFVFILLLILFSIFTFSPPNFPIFKVKQ